mgnify:CR=1 FL=1
MYADETSSKRWMYVALLLAIVVIGNTAVLFYTIQTSGTLNPELLKRIRNLERQIETKNNQTSSQMKSLEEQIENLNTRLRNIGYLNNTGTQLLAAIYNITKNSVVSIENRMRSGNTLIPKSFGSGFLYGAGGHIVTNNHVVEGASELVVTFLDGNVSRARMIGTDPYSDLAIIKLERNMSWLKPLPLGRSSALQVGETVVAVGSPFGLSSTMTAGIVSHVGRDLDAPGGYRIVDVIQHDVAINPGNSGGPLVNLLGEVVGINTAIVSESGTSSGVGFAIPSDTITREAPYLIDTGTYKHPYLGIRGVDVNPDIAEAASLNMTWGFLITEVVPSGPADKAGIRGGNVVKTVLGQNIRIGGDLIILIDGKMVRRLDDLSVYMERNKRPGDNITLTTIQSGKKLIKTVVLGERPPPS